MSDENEQTRMLRDLRALKQLEKHRQNARLALEVLTHREVCGPQVKATAERVLLQSLYKLEEK